jgi:diguanylate cyclase (GGDEF)-like protein/PAS domain S-box-containing protein
MSSGLDIARFLLWEREAVDEKRSAASDDTESDVTTANITWLRPPSPQDDSGEESSVLVRTLRKADERLDELHAGSADPVVEPEGTSFLLHRAQVDALSVGAARRAAVMNALPAHIILVDMQGRSISWSDAGRQLDCFNPLIDTNYGLGLGLDYLAAYDGAPLDSSSQIQRVATGIRSVLAGKASRYCCEYVTRSNLEERWYLVTVTPMNEDYPTGAVVVYLDITGQKQGEAHSRRFGAAMDAMVDGILLVSRSTMRFVHANDAACRMLGLTRGEMLALGPEEALGTSAVELQSSYDILIESGIDAEPIEMLRPGVDGVIAWIEVRRRAQYTGDGWTIVTFLRDVTERKIAENRIACLNRVHAMLSGINTLIVHERDRKSLMKKACRIAVEDGGLRLSMMALIDRATSKFMPVGLASKDKRLRSAVRSALEACEGVPTSMVKQAIREKRAVVSNDSQRDPKVAFAKLHVVFGVRSMAIFPLIIANEVIGVLSLYADECQFFHEEEVKLLTELTNDVAFAVDHIEKQERLEYLASYDVVTGLANRSLFMDRVAQLLRRLEGNGLVHALLLIDLHAFRNVNDGLGRSVGDALLRQVAGWLKCNILETNLVSRVGVDHFAVLLPGVGSQSDLGMFLERLVTGFANHPFILNGAEFRITARVGVSLYPEAGAEVDSLLKHAEAALKKAKASGDRYLFYTRNMSDAIAGKLTLESRLHQALDKDQFVLFYQPKMHLASGRITGVEALIRWNDPQSGLVMPDHFIGILEEKGMIREVGRWVLRKAVADHLRWRRAGLNSVRVAVNVSPLQLRNPGFVNEVEQVIAVDSFAAAGLELEMTESLVMEDIKHNIESLEAIRSMGVFLAIDDFGTGFSSLSYLAKLPVHTLKIDRSFISDLTTGPEAIALVSTIIKLGHSMNLNVVAEGVETEQQSRLLRLLKCDEIQGYLSSMPMSSKIFEARYLLSPQTA